MPSKMDPKDVDHIIVHNYGDTDKDLSAKQIDVIHKRNVDSQGRHWSGIGYHLVVRENGDVEPGRPLNLQGAHASGSTVKIPNLNGRSIGIAMSSNRDFDKAPQLQQDALVKRVAKLARDYDVDPSNILGHDEVEPKNGDMKYRDMEIVRSRVRELLNQPDPDKAQKAAAPAKEPAQSPKSAAKPEATKTSSLVTGRFTNPLPDKGNHVVTHTFLKRGKDGYVHRGLDFNTRVGERVNAMDGGKVVRTKETASGRSGKLVMIEHGKTGFTSMYQHLDTVGVKLGDIVRQNDPIGTSGRSGTEKPHLHVAVTKGVTWKESGWHGDPKDYVDPAKLIGKTPYAKPEGSVRSTGTAQKPEADAPPAKRDLLQKDMTGPDVLALQHQMKGLGYDPGTLDGVFDADLQKTIRQFQADRSLDERYQTGNAGPITQREITAAANEKDRDGGRGHDLRLGAHGEDVRRAQHQLAGLGYGDTSEVTTVFDARMEALVRTFQADRGMPKAQQTGAFDAATRREIERAITDNDRDGRATPRPATAQTPPGGAAPGGDGASGRNLPDSPDAVFVREADGVLTTMLTGHTRDVPGAREALVAGTYGPGSGPLGATTAEDVQAAFARFDAAASPLTRAEASALAPILDARAQLVAEGVQAPGSDGASAQASAQAAPGSREAQRGAQPDDQPDAQPTGPSR